MEVVDKLLEVNSFLVALGLGGIVAISTNIFKQLKNSKQQTEQRFKNLEEANLALLHDKIYQQCSFFLEQGWIPVDDLENLDYIWRGYYGLGGNGTGEALYKKVLELPNKEVIS
ncbi:hypothetical protein [Candidatus Enterococcus ikei]|uniref:Phage protein n=1 Tax=Candidatus Enterococcus ikei TaxID=2815326 RepID=A0ABS3GUP8_9ENTE|nr:hypothetical protein [Enterococcus sp. DIV0869a]